MRETWVQSLGWEDPLEKEMTTHSSILAWRIPWTEKPGGLQSMGSQSQIRLKRLSMHAACSNYILDCVSWVSRLTLLGLTTNWTYKSTLGMKLIHM